MLEHKHEHSSYAYSGVMFSEEIISISIKCSLIVLKSFAYIYALPITSPLDTSDISLGIRRNARF